MGKLLQKTIFFSLFCFFGLSSFANNIRVKKLSLTDTITSSKDVKIKFDLSWENSWRDDINWDAAWITAKVKRPDGSWKHIKFQSLGNSIDGNPQSAKIVIPEDKMGAFIYRSAKGTGSIDLSGIKLAWNYGLDSVSRIDTAEIRLFATEMVYVPQGSFAFGDSYTPGPIDMMNPMSMYNINYNGILPIIFKDFNIADTVKYGSKTPAFVMISDKSTPKLSVARSTSWGPDQVIQNGIFIHGLKGIGITELETYKYSNFPVGYKPFYCMKYEVTQGQYTDFINTTKVLITTSIMPGSTNLLPQSYSPSQPLGRFSIEKQGDIFTVSRPDRAMDYVNTSQLFAYANWGSLRPMTELEFEKACRGPLAPSPNDKSQGAQPSTYDGSKLISNIRLSGPENGNEYPLGVDSSKYLQIRYGSGPADNLLIDGGDGLYGPYRAGIFATSSSSRISSGSSFYGIMGLTDNVQEQVISINTELGRSFLEDNGRGENKKDGSPFLVHWLPSYNDQMNSYISAGQLMIQKSSTVSERNSAMDRSGFRLVRSAPSDN